MMVGTYQVPCSTMSFMSSRIHERAVLDRIDAAEHRAANGFGAVRMRGDREAIVVRRRDDGADLLERQLRIVAAGTLIEHAARGHDLDEIVAQLVMQAHGFGRILRAVDDARRRDRDRRRGRRDSRRSDPRGRRWNRSPGRR